MAGQLKRITDDGFPIPHKVIRFLELLILAILWKKSCIFISLKMPFYFRLLVPKSLLLGQGFFQVNLSQFFLNYEISSDAICANLVLDILEIIIGSLDHDVDVSKDNLIPSPRISLENLEFSIKNKDRETNNLSVPNVFDEIMTVFKEGPHV